MDLTPRLRLMNWLVSQGLTGMPENDLIRGFCERCRAQGLDLSRGLVFIDTLHPIFEGRGFRWNDSGTNESESFEYGPTADGDAAGNWRAPPSSFTCSKTVMMKCGSILPIAPRSISR
jgi:adenylate cyclase